MTNGNQTEGPGNGNSSLEVVYEDEASRILGLSCLAVAGELLKNDIGLGEGIPGVVLEYYEEEKDYDNDVLRSETRLRVQLPTNPNQELAVQVEITSPLFKRGITPYGLASCESRIPTLIGIPSTTKLLHSARFTYDEQNDLVLHFTKSALSLIATPSGRVIVAQYSVSVNRLTGALTFHPDYAFECVEGIRMLLEIGKLVKKENTKNLMKSPRYLL